MSAPVAGGRFRYRQAIFGNAMLSAACFLLLGVLVALHAKVSLQVTTALAGALGVYHGYLNGIGMGEKPGDWGRRVAWV